MHTPANADWRLATTAEKDAYIAADPKPANNKISSHQNEA
jgi:hypothetical protein